MFIRELSVAPIADGFHLVALITDSITDGMYDRMSHPAVFRNQAAAEAFRQRVQKNVAKINLNNWRLTDHPCAAFQMKADDLPGYYCPL